MSIKDGFKSKGEIVGGITPLLNTNEEGSEAIFRYKGVVDEERNEYAVEILNPTTKENDKAIVRFRSQVVGMIASEKIMEGHLYYIQYKGKTKTKSGNQVCQFKVEELEG